MKKIVLLLIFFSSTLLATEPHGFVKTSINLGVRGDNKLKFINTNVRTQINLYQDLGENGSVTASFDLLYEKYMNSTPELKIIPVETYAQYSGKNFGIKAGKYYDFWGLFDWISPTDILDPWDMTHISSDIEDYRISIYGINLSYGSDILNAEINLLPFFQHSIFPMDISTEEVPSNQLKEIEIGAKLSGIVEKIGLDWDLYYFRGRDRNPSRIYPNPPAGNLAPVTGTPSTPPLIKEYYQKLTMYGIDFSIPVSSLLFKLEGAYFLTEDRKGNNPLIENPYFSTVGGFDWSVIPTLTLSLSYKLKSYTKFNKKIDTRGRKNNNFFTFSLKYQPKDYLNFQWISIYQIDDKSTMSLSFISYSIIDDYTLTLGEILFYGKNQTTYGKFTDYSEVFVELKGSF